MSIATAKRRRRQAVNGYNHIAKIGRPIYSTKSKDKAARQQQRVIEKQRQIALRKGMSSKNKK